MDSSPKLLWDDPTLYSESCGVMDPTIRDLDQQIMLNDMILCANGGMPYLDPALQGNRPPVFDNSWQQYYQDGFEGSSSLPPSSSTDPSHTQTSAGSSQMMMDANAKLCDRSRGQPQAPSSENRTSHHPSARAPYHHGAARGSESNSSSKGTSCSSKSASATSSAAVTSISANSPPKSASGNQNQDPEPRRNPNVNPANRRAATTQQKKQLYHYQQQQQHGRMLAESQAAVAAAAAVKHEAAMLATAAKVVAEVEAARTTTGPPDRHLDLTQRDMSTAVRQVAEMGSHLRNAAHEQRKMVDDTLSQWTGAETTRV